MNFLQEKFKEIENEFHSLREKYRQGDISEQEYKESLRKLRLNDQEGRCWTIGARSGKWYYFDGKKWVEAKPPSLQEGKAICIYCGYENDIENEVCKQCGGGLEAELKSSHFPDFSEKAGLERDTFEPVSSLKDTIWSKPDFRPNEAEESKDYFDGKSPVYSLRFLSPVSFFLFWGTTGFFIGVVLGVFAGATRFFPWFVEIFPRFLESMQGKIMGGIAYGLLSGIFFFISCGILGYLLTVLINWIFSLVGGIKIRLEKEKL